MYTIHIQRILYIYNVQGEKSPCILYIYIMGGKIVMPRTRSAYKTSFPATLESANTNKNKKTKISGNTK